MLKNLFFHRFCIFGEIEEAIVLLSLRGEKIGVSVFYFLSDFVTTLVEFSEFVCSTISDGFVGNGVVEKQQDGVRRRPTLDRYYQGVAHRCV